MKFNAGSNRMQGETYRRTLRVLEMILCGGQKAPADHLWTDRVVGVKLRFVSVSDGLQSMHRQL